MKIVCVCACVSEGDIISEIRNGYDNVDALASRLNLASQCGSCLFRLEELIEQVKLDSVPPPALQFMKIIGG